MITDLPMMRRDLIARAFRPEPTSSVDAALKTLRINGCVTKGVPVAIRGARAGRLAGRVVLYAALNRDAAQLARLGDYTAAKRLAREAAKLEASAPFRRVTRQLEGTRVATIEYPRFLFAACRESLKVERDLSELAVRIQRVRENYDLSRAGETCFAGRVLLSSRPFANLISEGGEAFALPMEQLEDWNLVAGDVVVVRTAGLGLGMGRWQVEPAFHVSHERGDPPSNPLAEEPRPLSTAEYAELEALVAGEPTVAPLAPVAIQRL